MTFDFHERSLRVSLTLLVLVGLACIAGAVGGAVTAGIFARSWIPEPDPDGQRPRLQPRKPSLEATGNGNVSTLGARDPLTERLTDSDGE